MVEIVGSPKGKYVGINVVADQDEEIFLNVRGKDKSAKVTIDDEGICEIKANQECSLFH